VLKLSTTTRISLTLAFLTVSLLLAADIARLVPDVIGAELRGREALCEAVALQSSEQVVRGDIAGVETALRQIASRNRDVLSVAVRRIDGTIVTEINGHSRDWTLPPGAPSTPTQVRVPVFRDNQPWGTVELRFREIAGVRWGPLQYPMARLGAFLLFGGLLLNRLYLRRVLHYLDPSLVIPERVKLMLDTLAEGILVLDPRGEIVLANQSFAAIEGQSPKELLGVPASRFGWCVPGEPDRLNDDALPWTEALQSGTVHRGVMLTLPGADGTRTFSVNAAPITTGGRAVQGAVVTFDDVTGIERNNRQLQDTLQVLQASRDEIDRQNRELKRLAMTDPLTGCLNRRAFFAQFDTLWAAAQRHAHPLACLMVDVDHFKRINDNHGHATGDLVLLRVAAILQSLLRESDLICRYGGEEFCVLLPHTDLAGALEAAERFRAAIADDEPCGDIRITASLGVAGTNDHMVVAGAAPSTPQALVNRADEALYTSKRTGRNRVTAWSGESATAAAPH
jgi:diguanylate cyclase (GGDEF)-like protein/PAS domain S-box-containing protein